MEKNLGVTFVLKLTWMEVIAKTKNSPKEYFSTFELVIKSQPLSEDARTFLKPNKTFEKEAQMYPLVIIDMANYVKKHISILFVNHEIEVLSTPKCYFKNYCITRT